MKAKHIKEGECYIARVSKKLVTVQVDSIHVGWDYLKNKEVTLYEVTNLDTKRPLTFRSAAKFRRAAGLPRFDFQEGKIVVVSSSSSVAKDK